MELEVGSTYNSPIHGRYIQVLDIEIETKEILTLSILWVEKDSLDTEMSQLVVLKSDVRSWNKVEL